ncbi:PD-(D/E)XK nuclease-like domain-containing protein [Fibrella forsythiae]|uniref:PD-(D/E)XK nuclease-like domain-containing protein n=1 Tax=Fibrella forsythiae TaxID=2817061 RepID=A0ABS3JLJ4_9BACT|nr:PD-(D/E)XK nuclease-like domain-containing protein [Fibrella forsythiae]MBO0950870.1 PD-(D/E)XK nuclease-like domain-containing protein [Fibrella forsythiae]
MDYRSLPRISNSDLSELLADVKGEVKERPVKAFAFGSSLHELILEPHTIQDLPENVDLVLLQKLASVARADPFLSWALRFSKKETIRLWQDPITGLALKSKLDLIYKGRLIIDIKSTSCRTYADFLKSCETYEYDRQAAFYLDSIGGKKFVFIAIQKSKPFNVWMVEYHTNGSFIESGRKKYRRLLREWKHRELIGKPFIPSTWNCDALSF